MPDTIESVTTSPPLGRPASKRLRVVFCSDNLGIGGTELNAIRTAERLDRSRFDLALVLLQADGPLRSRYEAAGIPVHSFPIGSMWRPRAIRHGRKLVRFLREFRPDVFHSHDVYSNVFGTVCARIAGVPAILTSRRWAATLPQPKLRLANRIAFRMADGVLANSESVALALTEADGVPAARIGVVPNFVEAELFEPVSAVERAALRRSLGLPAEGTIVGIVARLAAVKDHDSFLRAAAIVTQRRPDVIWAIVGDGEMAGRLRDTASQLGLGDCVVFTGLRPNRPNPHQAFDVSVLCSLSEGFPNSVVEAMAAGRPVVATAVGGVRDAIRDGSTGLLVPPADPAALAEAMMRVLDDAALRKRLGEAGQEWARKTYSETAALSALESFYRRMMPA